MKSPPPDLRGVRGAPDRRGSPAVLGGRAPLIRWRRQYGDVLRDRAVRGDWLGLAGLATRWLATVVSPRSRRPRAGPALGTLLVTYHCNLVILVTSPR